MKTCANSPLHLWIVDSNPIVKYMVTKLLSCFNNFAVLARIKQKWFEDYVMNSVNEQLTYILTLLEMYRVLLH